MANKAIKPPPEIIKWAMELVEKTFNQIQTVGEEFHKFQQGDLTTKRKSTP